MSAVRSQDTVERFRTSVEMKRNCVANNWTKHYVGIDVVCATFVFLYETAREQSKYEDGRYVNDQQSTHCPKLKKTLQHKALPTCECDVVNNV